MGLLFVRYQFLQGAKLRTSAEGHRRHRQRRARLLEQGASAAKLRDYDKRWLAWCHGAWEDWRRRKEVPGRVRVAGCGRLNWRALNAPSEHGLLRAHAPMKEERTP